MPSTHARKAVSVTRSEFEALRTLVEQNSATADRNRTQHEIEFKRIAELQVTLDRLAAIVKRLVPD